MTSLNITDSDLAHAKDKVVIVTGGSSGIGLATSQLLSSLSAHVVVADINPPPTSLPNTTFHRTDVSKWSDLVALFKATYEKYGRIDVLVANAGVGELEDVLADEYDPDGELKEPTWVVLNVNLRGCLNSVKLAVHYMRQQGTGGGVVITASAASYGAGGIPVYAAAKCGVLGFMRGSHKTLAKDNITINCVAPFFTESLLIYPSLRKMCNANNIPISAALSVGKALVYCAVKGREWTGKCVYIAADRWVEVEERMRASRSMWLGEEFDGLAKRLDGAREDDEGNETTH